ncbi:hypothetical protein [Nostoc sp. PA-18-2419]|uniref:hypothetical protein n=1 Tax=Nostoc sp. PA-18-2419 TaxID=2575443 RepID=UPI0011094195|nr:hypothetical protein [Nostoc sp. PA-18-2419]
MTTATQLLEQSVVMFYQNFLPLCEINIKRVLVLLVTKKTQVLGFTTEIKWQIHLLKLVMDVEGSTS